MIEMMINSIVVVVIIGEIDWWIRFDIRFGVVSLLVEKYNERDER